MHNITIVIHTKKLRKVRVLDDITSILNLYKNRNMIQVHRKKNKDGSFKGILKIELEDYGDFVKVYLGDTLIEHYKYSILLTKDDMKLLG